jgi:DNA-directed RNA polymerase subunit RPC12/RpoP
MKDTSRTLSSVLDRLTAPAELAIPQPDGSVRCTACGHRCLVRNGRRGICQVRYHDGQGLRVPWGYVSGLNADPVEKKPFYHFLPGSIALKMPFLKVSASAEMKCGRSSLHWSKSQGERCLFQANAAPSLRQWRNGQGGPSD